MKKILIALESSFTTQALQDNLLKEGFHVATTDSGKETLDIIREAPPDIVLADANLPEINAFEILDNIKKDESTKRVPIIVFSRTGSDYHREKAMDYEAKDFVVGLSDSLKAITLRIKKHLGLQRAYNFDINPDTESSTMIAQDLGYRNGARCPSCKTDLSLQLLRNLSFGENVFNVSLICPHCYLKEKS